MWVRFFAIHSGTKCYYFNMSTTTHPTSTVHHSYHYYWMHADFHPHPDNLSIITIAPDMDKYQCLAKSWEWLTQTLDPMQLVPSWQYQDELVTHPSHAPPSKPQNVPRVLFEGFMKTLIHRLKNWSVTSQDEDNLHPCSLKSRNVFWIHMGWKLAL